MRRVWPARLTSSIRPIFVYSDMNIIISGRCNSCGFDFNSTSRFFFLLLLPNMMTREVRYKLRVLWLNWVQTLKPSYLSWICPKCSWLLPWVWCCFSVVFNAITNIHLYFFSHAEMRNSKSWSGRVTNKFHIQKIHLLRSLSWLTNKNSNHTCHKFFFFLSTYSW